VYVYIDNNNNNTFERFREISAYDMLKKINGGKKKEYEG